MGAFRDGNGHANFMEFTETIEMYGFRYKGFAFCKGGDTAAVFHFRIYDEAIRYGIFFRDIELSQNIFISCVATYFANILYATCVG